MSAIATDNEHRLAFIDSLRCFAALWVVLFHLSEGRHIPTLLAAIPDWLRFIVFDAGHLGVPVFFVLSGIVMAATTLRVPMTTKNAAHFVARRLARLAPPYYAAVALGIAVLTVKHVSGQSEIAIPSVIDVLAHLVFIQGFIGIPNIITVFWTLCIEVQFYIAFASLLWVAEKAGGGESLSTRNVAIWVSAFGALLWPTELTHSIGWQGGFVGFWYSFMAGVLCGQTLLGTRQSQIIAVSYCALILFLGISAPNSFATAVGLTGLSFCFMVKGSSAIKFISSYPVQKLGLISYSIYLFHTPVTGTFMRIFRRIVPHGLAADALAAILAVAACIAFAAIAHIVFERPAIAWSRRIRLKRTPITAT